MKRVLVELLGKIALYTIAFLCFLAIALELAFLIIPCLLIALVRKLLGKKPSRNIWERTEHNGKILPRGAE
jgi:hypothetical protein